MSFLPPPVSLGAPGLHRARGFPLSPEVSVSLQEALCCREVATRGWRTVVAKGAPLQRPEIAGFLATLPSTLLPSISAFRPSGLMQGNGTAP